MNNPWQHDVNDPWRWAPSMSNLSPYMLRYDSPRKKLWLEGHPEVKRHMKKVEKMNKKPKSKIKKAEERIRFLEQHAENLSRIAQGHLARLSTMDAEHAARIKTFQESVSQSLDLAKAHESRYVCLLTLIPTLPEGPGKDAMLAVVKAFGQ